MIKEEIIKTFSDFMGGYRFIMLVHRNKEGGKSNRSQKNGVKRITKNRDEFIEVLGELQGLKAKSKVPMRIYSCVNARDIEKTIREFKRRQLEADYYDTESKHGFYLDIKNQWISSLMKPGSRAETKFLIDIDDIITTKKDWDISIVVNHLREIGVEIILKYPTRNGVHIITEPFNPNDFNGEFGEVKKDALLLLDY